MRRLPIAVSLLRILAGVFVFCLGYLVAVMSFRQDEWMDYHSGASKITCTVFPFSLSTRTGPSPFAMVFGASVDDGAEWHLFDSRGFNHPGKLLMPDVLSTRESHFMARTHAYLVRYVLKHNLDSREREALVDEFIALLRTKGPMAAISFVDSLKDQELQEFGDVLKGAGKAPAKTE